MRVRCADKFQESIVSYLDGMTHESRAKAVAEIKAIISEAVLGLGDEASVCPACGCPDLTKNGHTAAGTQRYRCKHCGRTLVPGRGRIFGLTKLPEDV